MRYLMILATLLAMYVNIETTIIEIDGSDMDVVIVEVVP